MGEHGDTEVRGGLFHREPEDLFRARQVDRRSEAVLRVAVARDERALAGGVAAVYARLRDRAVRLGAELRPPDVGRVGARPRVGGRRRLAALVWVGPPT